MKFSILISLSLSTITGFSQMETELQDFDLESARPENQYKWQVNLDITSITAYMLGGNTYGNAHVGLGAKYRFGTYALRFQTEYYGNSSRNSWSPSSRLVAVAGNERVYLNTDELGWMVRSGCGLEKGWEKERTRIYLLADLLGTYERISVFASNRNTTLQDPTGGWLESYNRSTTLVNSFGVGLIPGAGYEFYVWKRLGFTLEAKLDLNATVSPAYQIDDNANILLNGRNIYFRTFPLLDFRIHYRI